MFPLPDPIPPLWTRDAAQAGVTVLLRCKGCGRVRAAPASRLVAIYGNLDLHRLPMRLRCTACGARATEAIPIQPWRPIKKPRPKPGSGGPGKGRGGNAY